MDLLQKAINLGFSPINKEYYLWEIQRWLRETYGLSVEVNFKIFGVELCNGWYYSIMFTKRYTKSFSTTSIMMQVEGRIGARENGKDLFSGFKTYEEALEQGLFEALKLIK